MNSIPRYRQRQVLSILPMLTKADLNNWIGRGTLTLDHPEHSPHLYSIRDLVALACMYELREQYVHVGAAAKIAMHAKDRLRNWRSRGRPCVFVAWFHGAGVKVLTVYQDQLGERLNRVGAEPVVMVFAVDDVIEMVHEKLREAGWPEAA